MARYAITGDWAMELDEGFDRRASDGDVMFWQPETHRTVWAAVYATENVEAEEAIQHLLEGRPGEPHQTFDRVEAGLVGHAYLLPEEGGPGKRRYWGLNTWTAARGSVACVTFYFEDIRDLPWALRAWHSVSCGPCEPKRYFN